MSQCNKGASCIKLERSLDETLGPKGATYESWTANCGGKPNRRVSDIVKEFTDQVGVYKSYAKPYLEDVKEDYRKSTGISFVLNF